MANEKPRICVVSGSDSDLGGLVPVAEELRAGGARVFWIAVGPANREPPPAPRVMVKLYSPPRGQVAEVARFTARVQERITDLLADRRPDFVVLLGDRHEILAAACAACLLRIPFGQIHAGELALGQTDNRVRHAVSRMADLMFAPDEVSRRRLVAWGEPPPSVYKVGSPFVDGLCPIAATPPIRNLRSLEYVLCILHPVSSDDEREYVCAGRILRRVESLRRSLARQIGREAKAVLVEPCPDPGRYGIIRRWQEAVAERPDIVLYRQRMRRKDYLRLLTHSWHVLANSSGLFTEAPALGVPMTLIGKRQKGRRLRKVTASKRPVLDRPLPGGPYGGPGAARKIARVILSRLRRGGGWTAKEFRDIAADHS